MIILMRMLLASIFIMLIGILLINYIIQNSGNDQIHYSVNTVPVSHIAIVLGTSEKLKGGSPNLYFDNRIEAAAKLYLAGKVKKILVSGDNSEKYYNEPMAMKKSLMQKGVPSGDIVLDYAGFRTFDSMVRAKKIFGIDSAIIVSQSFHLPRAIYIAKTYELNAIGFSAEDPPRLNSVRFREFFARIKAFLDCTILNTKPYFLGKPEPIQL